MLRIPFAPSKNADQSFKVDLGGVVVAFRVRWSVRDQAWYLDLEAAGNRIPSVKVVPDSPLLASKATVLRDLGDLVALKQDAQGPAVIGYGDLGNAWGLFWMSREELDGA